MLTPEGCRQRLDRLRSVMARRGLDAALISDRRHVYYFCGYLGPWFERPVLVVDDAAATLFCGREPESTSATDVRTFSPTALGTIRDDQTRQIAQLATGLLRTRKRVGVERSACDGWLMQAVRGRPADIEADILRLRRRKDVDELAVLHRAAACLDACYEYAAGRIEPGLDEVQLYGELYRVAVEAAGEPVGRFGNDFQCGTPGGPPRRRAAQAGELWILDLAVEYRGYTADASRVFAVGGEVSDEQRAAWAQLVHTLEAAERTIRPGLSCAALYAEVRERLERVLSGGFPHHLGHGVGLGAHEAPHLNPHWDDSFEAGDVFTVEPGLYAPSLRGGLRLENLYVLGPGGVENLIRTPLELVR